MIVSKNEYWWLFLSLFLLSFTHRLLFSLFLSNSFFLSIVLYRVFFRREFLLRSCSSDQKSDRDSIMLRNQLLATSSHEHQSHRTWILLFSFFLCLLLSLSLIRLSFLFLLSLIFRVFLSFFLRRQRTSSKSLIECSEMIENEYSKMTKRNIYVSRKSNYSLFLARESKHQYLIFSKSCI